MPRTRTATAHRHRRQPASRRDRPGRRFFVGGAAVLVLAGGAYAAAGQLLPGLTLQPNAPPSDTGGGQTAAVEIGGRDRPTPTAEQGTSRRPRGHWLSVLEQIDRRRARAWSRGDPRLLRAVYTPRSPELGADQAMLRSYLARGVRVTGVRLSFSQLAVES
ncbi:MAG: hypothetical protein ACRDPG_05300, partial [Nocardioidaceae bacterium]